MRFTTRLRLLILPVFVQFFFFPFFEDRLFLLLRKLICWVFCLIGNCFIPHIKALKAKCLKALDILKVLSNTNWGGDRSVLLNLYRSLVRSKLDYGSIVYGSARKSYLNV